MMLNNSNNEYTSQLSSANVGFCGGGGGGSDGGVCVRVCVCVHVCV